MIPSYNKLGVLILVLMEDTLRGALIKAFNDFYKSLNPCFNGRYYQRDIQVSEWY